jgi:tetratricopeptide (TPR) repeat protein
MACLGDVATGMEHLERAIALFDPRQHLEGFRFGTSSGVVAHTTSALLEWLRGNLDRSAERSRRAIELANELNHPYSSAYILFHTAVLDLWRRQLRLAHERAGEALDVAEEHGYPIWEALALMLQGAAETGLGRAESGLATMERGVALYQGLTTPAVFWPLVLATRARGFAYAGQAEQGIQLIDQAIEMVGADAVLNPDFGVLRAELLIALGETGPAVAQLRRVVDDAGRLGLRTPRLRAATMLVRLRDANAVDLLRHALETFVEGFDDADLVDARAALAEVDLAVG